VDRLARDGMDKAKGVGVQSLALERDFELRLAPRTVNRLTDYRMSDFSQVNADLVGAPCLKAASEPRGDFAESLDNFVVRNSPDAVAWCSGDPSAAVATVGDERQIDRSPGPVHMAFDDCIVFPLNGVHAKKRLKRTQSTR